MNQQALEKYLWGAAVALRGTIDAGDYKQYIFPLLFFKRICDVWDEEYQKALDASDGDMEYVEFAEHRLRVKNNLYLPEVMLQFMFWANTKGYFRGFSGHSTIAHLTAVTLKEIKIPEIPINKQVEIKIRFDIFQKTTEIIESKITESKALQKSLTNQVF